MPLPQIESVNIIIFPANQTMVNLSTLLFKQHQQHTKGVLQFGIYLRYDTLRSPGCVIYSIRNSKIVPCWLSHTMISSPIYTDIITYSRWFYPQLMLANGYKWSTSLGGSSYSTIFSRPNMRFHRVYWLC